MKRQNQPCNILNGFFLRIFDNFLVKEAKKDWQFINVATGDIHIVGGNYLIGSTLTRTKFLEESFLQEDIEANNNNPFFSYGPIKINFAHHKFCLTLSFLDEQLSRVWIACSDPEYGTSWEEYTTAKEMKRKHFHEAILRNSIGSDGVKYDFPWGTIDSLYDPKGGSSHIQISYRT